MENPTGLGFFLILALVYILRNDITKALHFLIEINHFTRVSRDIQNFHEAEGFLIQTHKIFKGCFWRRGT